MTTHHSHALDPDTDEPAPAAPDDDSDDESDTPWLLPVWFEYGLVVVTAALVSVVGAGLLLAVLGRYGLASALLWGLLGTALFVGLALPRLTRRREGRSAHAPTVAMLVVAAVSALANGLSAGHYVAVDRDPGVYAVAARWIARTGLLQVQGGAPWTQVATTTNYASIGMYPEPGGILEFQFNHGLPVLLAVARGLGGDRAMFGANAVVGALGLLAVYAVGVRMCRRPWLVVAAVTALGLTLPELLFSRDTYSEPLTQLLLWSALWLLLTSWERRHLGLAALGGLALGATVMARIDALLYLGALPAVAGLVWVVVRTRERRVFTAAWVLVAAGCAAPPAILGSVDLTLRSTGYFTALRTQVVGLRLLLLASAVVGVLIVLVVPLVRPLLLRAARVRSRVAAVAGVVVLVALVLAWALRPALQQLTGVVNSTTGALQAREGVPVAPRLTYAEYSLTWFSWYLGPVTVVLALVGLALVTRWAVRGRPAMLLVLATTGPAAALYLYAVSNTPEQVWAVRRYVPAVFPLFVLAAVVALEAVVAAVRLGPWRPVWGRVALAAGVVAFLVFPLGTLVPVRHFQTQSGYLPAIDRVCDTLGPDAAVVFAVGDIDGSVLSQTLRSFCGVPTTRFAVGTDPSAVQPVLATLRAQGRTMWVLGSSQAVVEAALGGTVPARLIAGTTNNRKLETTLLRVPDSYTSETLEVWGARIG